MRKYELRFFFDASAGVCIWSSNDAARDRFGYAIDARCLPLPENTWRRVRYVCAWFDTSLDWDYPPGPSPWDAAVRSRFNTEAQYLLNLLRDQLGSEFEVADESGTALEAKPNG